LKRGAESFRGEDFREGRRGNSKSEKYNDKRKSTCDIKRKDFTREEGFLVEKVLKLKSHPPIRRGERGKFQGSKARRDGEKSRENRAQGALL